MTVSPLRIYRFCIWLPLMVPAALLVVMNVLINGFGMPKPSGVLDVVLERVAYSGLYGGLPYFALASWASWWIRDRSETTIRAVMFVAPLLMVAVFGVACILMGAQQDRMAQWIGVFKLGTSVIIPLGYFYVALTLLLRRWLGQGPIAPSSSLLHHG